MAPRKPTPRRRWTPRTTHGAFDVDDDRLDSFDLDAELGELDELLGDPLDQVVMAIARPPRPVRATRDELRSQLLTRTWCARADDCGAGATCRERGIDYLVHGAVLDLQVGPRRLAATVHGTRRYRVDVALTLPRQADMQATLARVQQARTAAAADPRRAPAGQHATTRGLRAAGELRREARLADPALADNQRQPAAPGREAAAHLRDESSERRVPPREPRTVEVAPRTRPAIPARRGPERRQPPGEVGDLVVALARLGDPREAQGLFERCETEYGVKPTLHAYTAIIAAFGAEVLRQVTHYVIAPPDLVPLIRAK